MADGEGSGRGDRALTRGTLRRKPQTLLNGTGAFVVLRVEGQGFQFPGSREIDLE